jgi:hypothetical protein
MNKKEQSSKLATLGMQDRGRNKTKNASLSTSKHKIKMIENTFCFALN